MLTGNWLKSLTKLPLSFHPAESRRTDPRMPASAKEKNFPCPNCPTGFSEKGSLTRHLRYECGQEPRFACPYCTYRTKWTSSIYNHVRNKHEGQRVYCVDIYADETCMAGRRSTMLTPTKNVPNSN
ncbi:PREDICTED: zinc finger X-chromosomal protein-like [Ceratosolen solmsi marchali]|uniref:Zinc finger X-chromosomal protein-like n=1 Tax=Ceratosolen solmsi marchali TaxID=326594 RepID=A0AAJ6YWW5_9HYME|nr:PREDICTED: zinc finger X-chromosomal protein-like [Ceratosolen solmsi marchali]